MSTKKGAKKVTKVSKTNTEETKIKKSSKVVAEVAEVGGKLQLNGQSFLQAGYVVVGDVHLNGCTSYAIEDREMKERDAQRDENWKTHKVIKSITEHNDLQENSSVLRRSITKLGISYGTMTVVPASKSGELDAALKNIDATCKVYNTGHKYTSLTPSYMVFRVASNDARLAKLMYGRLFECASEIAKSITAGDINGLRGWVSRMGALEDILPSDTASIVVGVTAKLREQAREAVKKAKASAGASGDQEANLKKLVSKINAGPVASMRASLVEIDATVEKQITSLPMTTRFIE